MCLNDNYYVVMDNQLAKSKSNLTLNEIKLLRLVITQVIKDDTDFKTYKVSINQLSEIMGIQKNNLRRDLPKICKHLLQEVVYIIDDTKPKSKWKMFQWCSSCEYDDGTLIIKLHDNLKPYLINVSKYIQYQYNEIIVFESKHSIRLYELLYEELKTKSRIGIGQKAVITISVKLIQYATNTDTIYTKYSKLKEYVLDVAVNEINKKSIYRISFEPIRKDKIITHIQFTIENKIGKNLPMYEK